MITAVVILMFAIVGMPVFGVYLMISKHQDENRVLGAVLTVLGVIVWGIFGFI